MERESEKIAGAPTRIPPGRGGEDRLSPLGLAVPALDISEDILFLGSQEPGTPVLMFYNHC